MLVNFTVKNYKSYKDKTEFSMETGEGLPVDSNITLPVGYIDPVTKNHIVQDYLLKTTAVLGSNFQGKSNLLDALHFFKSTIISDNFFNLSSRYAAFDPSKPITWEVSLTSNYGETVKYTLVYDTDHNGTHRPYKLQINKLDDCETYVLFWERKEELKAVMKELTTNDDYQMLKSWLVYCIFASTDSTDSIPLIDNHGIDPKDKTIVDSLLSVLAYFDINKDDITGCFDYIDKFEDALFTLLYSDNFSKRLNQSGVGIAYLVRLIVTLYEMQGKKDSIIFVDDFDGVLSREFAKGLVKLFNSKANNCQVVITTRTPEVLKFGLRADQVWIANKNRHGASTLYSLFDFDECPDFDYLQGYRASRYGGTNLAVPDLVQQDFEYLVNTENKSKLY